MNREAVIDFDIVYDFKSQRLEDRKQRIKEMKFKTCLKCGKTKPGFKFKAEKRNKDGRSAICKVCRNQESLKNYYANREKILIHIREYQEKHRESLKKQAKKWYKKNRKAIKERNLKYYNENKEACQARRKAWIEKNKEKIKKYNREYKRKHKS